MPPKVGVGIGVLVIDGGRLLLGLRRGSHGSGTWALPGGWLEDGETFEACALRELEEETGIGAAQVLASGAAVIPVVSNNVTDGKVHSVTVFVRVPLGAAPDSAGGATAEPRVMEPDKCVEWRWCDLARPLPAPLFPPLAFLADSAYWRDTVLPTALPAGRVASPTPGAAPSDVGGASTDDPRDTVLLTPLPLPCGSLVPRVVCPTAGAVATFTGTTRETFEGRSVVRLEYEAYEAMARKEMLALCATVRARWPVRHIAIAHRTGTVPVTEASVEIAISSAHRAEALAACAFAIDELKAQVPIWKKEVYEDEQAVWKENREAAHVPS